MFTALRIRGRAAGCKIYLMKIKEVKDHTVINTTYIKPTL